jgi:NTE family protein
MRFKLLSRIYLLLSLVLLASCTSLDFTNHQAPFKPPLPIYENVKVALVLGGGGSRGLAHVGVIEELVAAGIYPDLIVGCSAGAIVGGLYADRPDIERIKRLLITKKREHLLDLSIEHLPYGVSSGVLLRRFLSEHIQADKFNELSIPFVAVATNLEFGDMVTFGTGTLIPAIRASAAYPGVFLPVKIAGQYFVDGAVSNPVPVEVARKLGAKFIIAVDLSGELTDTLPNHMLGVMRRSMEISYIHQSRIAAENADVLIKIPLKNIGTFHDGSNDHIYEVGREMARQAIKKMKQRPV